ncbi:MAG: hypothetical protein H7Y03_05275, partial [Chitinophagaceae bacterium]|nr:hypothetical protein [Chitinophagaceae bacterium]
MQILKIFMESKAPDVLANFYEEVLDLSVHRKDGVIEIAVIEAKLAAISVDVLPGTRFSEERARQFIVTQQPIGEPLSPEATQSGMRNL